MKLPDKFISYKESVLFKFPIILEELEVRDFSLTSLYYTTKSKFSNVNEYIDTIVCLFALKIIEMDEGVLHYVKTDKL